MRSLVIYTISLELLYVGIAYISKAFPTFCLFIGKDVTTHGSGMLIWKTRLFSVADTSVTVYDAAVVRTNLFSISTTFKYMSI